MGDGMAPLEKGCERCGHEIHPRPKAGQNCGCYDPEGECGGYALFVQADAPMTASATPCPIRVRGDYSHRFEWVAECRCASLGPGHDRQVRKCLDCGEVVVAEAVAGPIA